MPGIHVTPPAYNLTPPTLRAGPGGGGGGGGVRAGGRQARAPGAHGGSPDRRARRRAVLQHGAHPMGQISGFTRNLARVHTMAALTAAHAAAPSFFMTYLLCACMGTGV